MPRARSASSTPHALPADLPPEVPAERRAVLERMGMMPERDVCILLNIRADTLWTWRKEGRSPAFVRVGRETCYRAVDVQAWLAANVSGHDGVPSHQHDSVPA